MPDILNLIGTILLFYSVSYFTGNFIVRKLGLQPTHSASIGLVLISTTATYYAMFNLEYKWLAYFLLALTLFSMISRVYGSVKKSLTETNLSWLTSGVLIALPVVIFFYPTIKKHGLGVHSVGNLDPLMFGIISKHVEYSGFSSTLTLQNLDLGFNASWNWTGTQTLIAALSSIRHCFPSENGSIYISFIVTLYLITGISCVHLIRNLFKSKITNKLLITTACMVSIGLSNQINLFVIANGFVAQLLFMSLVPEFINSLHNAFQQEGNKNRTVAPGLIFGSMFSIYFAGAIIVTPIFIVGIFLFIKKNSFKSIQTIRWKNSVLTFFALIVTSLPALNFLKIYGISFLSTATPTWSIPSVNLFSLISGAPICQPIGNTSTCATPAAYFQIILSILVFILAIYGFESSRSKSKYAKPSVQYLVLTLMIILSLVASNKYQYWKIYTIVQLFFLTIYIPYWAIGGFLEIRKNAKVKKTKNHSIILCLSACMLLQGAFISSEIWKRSIWTYYTNSDAVSLQKSKILMNLKGINIQGVGSELMILALYAPTKEINIVGAGSYFTPGKEVYKYTLINKNQEAWINSKNKLSLNETYGLIH